MTPITKRLFVAIPISEKIRKELTALGKAAEENSFVRWTPFKNLHVTLHFIGATIIDDLQNIKNKIAAVTSRHQAFELKSDGLKIVKKKCRPKMIWVKFEKNKSFENLANDLQEELPGDEKKSPVPHVTLARIKEGKNDPDLKEPELKNNFNLRVSQIELWESQTKRSGAEYSKIADFQLKGT